MKKTVILFSLCVLFFGCTRDWGLPTTKNYPINGTFTGLEVSDAFEVTVSDEINDVVVTVGDLAHDKVIVKVIDGKLHIGLKPRVIYNGVATAVIPASVLREIELSGASSFLGDLSGNDVDIDLSGASTYKGNVIANEVDIDLSGASTYTGHIVANKIETELSGASTADIDGSCQNTMEIELSGASRLKAAHLDASVVRGNMSGASDADVTCCTSLKVDISGASTLTYGTVSADCDPVIDCTTSGGSTVRKRM